MHRSRGGVTAKKPQKAANKPAHSLDFEMLIDDSVEQRIVGQCSNEKSNAVRDERFVNGSLIPESAGHFRRGGLAACTYRLRLGVKNGLHGGR